MYESFNYFAVLYKKYKKIGKYRVFRATLEREPAFSVGHFRILYVHSMFEKYRRGVATILVPRPKLGRSRAVFLVVITTLVQCIPWQEIPSPLYPESHVHL
jgi:hypothetical protein